LTIRYRSTKTKQAPLRLRIRDLAEIRVGHGPSGDDPDSASALLRPVFEQFVQGRDTGDLKAAEQPLATLG
jgi:hypothetical protein